MYEQRAAPPAEDREPVAPWPARLRLADDSTEELRPGVEDWYVAIDDLAWGRIVFDAAPWPMVDGAGRLWFAERRETRTADVAAAQAVADGARAERGQQTRQLRIGDVFLVAGPELSEDVRDWRVLGDVTREAREAAKLALFAAVAPRLLPEEETMLPEPGEVTDEAGRDGGGEPAGGSAGHAFPAV